MSVPMKFAPGLNKFSCPSVPQGTGETGPYLQS